MDLYTHSVAAFIINPERNVRTVTAGRAFQWTRDKTGFKWTGNQLIIVTLTLRCSL